VKILSAILLILFASVNIYSQQEVYNWYFGSRAGITFSPSGSTPNTLPDGRLSSTEGCAAISDSTGNILFYTDGADVWNKNHTIMTNGSGLNGTGTASQSAIIIPNPSNNGIYYIFTINANSRTLAYSIVDINRNNGTGEIIQKNTMLLTSVTEKLSATLAGNGIDIYVVTHGLGNNNFYAFKISSNGVNTSPVISSVGTAHKASSTNAKGQMKLSPSGNTLAICIPDDELLEIFIFNTGTGAVTNPISIPLNAYTPYGLEFSPDNKKLFFSTGSVLFQYDISNRNINDIINSRVEIARADNRIQELQLAPDGKIYAASDGFSTLARINKPNESGSKVSFSLNSVNLNTGRSAKGLPAFIQSYMTYIFSPKILSACQGEDIHLNCTISRDEDRAFFTWTGPNGFFSDKQNPVINNVSPTNSGYYKVHVSLGALKFTDSTFVNVIPEPKARIVPDGATTLCFGDSLKLFVLPDSSDYSYYWSTGENTSSIIVSTPGTYYLTIESNGCSATDSIEITVVPSFEPEIKALGPKVICEGDSLILEAYPKTNVNSYLWSTGDTTESIIITKGGTYSVTINRDGCLRTTNIDILNLEKPKTQIKALRPTSFCIGDSTILIADPQNSDYSYLWSTGETTPSIVVKNTGIISLETISRNGCSATDTIEISSGDKLNVKITTQPHIFCEGDTINLSATPYSSQYKYLWSTGDTTANININTSGKYFVNVIAQGGCEGSDTIEIQMMSRPDAKIEQGEYAEICEGDSLVLNAQIYNPDYIYNWSSGATSPYITVKKSGLYYLFVENQTGCADTAIFELKVNPVPTVNIEVIRPKILCRGDSTRLIAHYTAQSSLTWSTGETSDTITIRKTGLYFVKAENQSRCSAYDTALVIFNPNKEPVILSDKGFSLCEGDTLVLSTEDEYEKYLWSTGDTNRTITITTPGTYFLTITDTNGCKATVSSEIKKAENRLDGIENIDFGKVLINTIDSREISFRNLSTDTVVISDVFILNDKNTYTLSKPKDTVKLGLGKEYTANVDFSPKEIKYYPDSIVISIEAPCKQMMFIKLEGFGTGIIEVRMPDTSGIIGVKNFRIPLYASIDKHNQDLIKLNYSAKIKFYADIFQPELLTNGIIKHDTIIDNERILFIQDSNVILTRGVSVLTELTGTILLGEHIISPLSIYDFQTDNPYLKINIQSGKLEAEAVCMQNLSMISPGIAASVTIKPNPTGNILNATLRNFAKGNYTVSIYSISGKKLESYTIHINSAIHTFELDLSRFENGNYIMSLNGGAYLLRQLFTIIK